MRYNQQDARDRAVLDLVDQLAPAQMALFDKMRPQSLQHYLEEQKPWLEDEIYFLGLRLNRPPKALEITDCILDEGHSLRFRAYYALRFPDRIVTSST